MSPLTFQKISSTFLSHHCVSIKAVSQNELGHIKFCHSRGKRDQHQNRERILGITVKNCANFNSC